jgi:hypothetical protein
MQTGLLQGNSDGPPALFKLTQCALGSSKIAAQQENNRRSLRDRTLGVVMKKSARASSVTVKIDRRVHLCGRASSVAKMLFRVATARIENGQAKVVCAMRRHCLVAQIRRGRRLGF